MQNDNILFIGSSVKNVIMYEVMYQQWALFSPLRSFWTFSHLDLCLLWPESVYESATSVHFPPLLGFMSHRTKSNNDKPHPSCRLFVGHKSCCCCFFSFSRYSKWTCSIFISSQQRQSYLILPTNSLGHRSGKDSQAKWNCTPELDWADPKWCQRENVLNKYSNITQVGYQMQKLSIVSLFC